MIGAFCLPHKETNLFTIHVGLLDANNNIQATKRVRKPSEKGVALATYEVDCRGEADELLDAPVAKSRRAVRSAPKKRKRDDKLASKAITGWICSLVRMTSDLFIF